MFPMYPGAGMAPGGPGGQPPMPPQQPQQPAAAGGGNSRVKFESALDFLEKVKTVFADQPGVYNQFLDIMKGFKTQTIDTPGVILRVKTLFKGHPDLIMGFNNFLPPGYKIELDSEDHEPAEEQQPEEEAPRRSGRGRAAPPAPASAPVGQAVLAAPMAGEPMQVEGEQRKQPEFDHARNYVKKIKLRFGSQPQVYKAFLEILHTFHREQHTIQDVYAQVAKLFANHPDLLSEFAQFLPDPNIHNGPDDAGGNANVQQSRPSARGGRARLTEPAVAQPAPVAPRPRAQPAPRARNDTQAQDKGSYGTFEELSFFFRIKQALTDNNRDPQSDAYQEFLKCLMLFNQDIITRQELYMLVKELLRPHDLDLLVWFRHFVSAEDSEPDEPMSVAEMDWSTAKKLGPSYREMPDRLRTLKCSGRVDDELSQSVLNDVWVSVPIGSEDGTRFLSSRKNQFEELLFKAEDDHQELDVMIESNLAGIRLLEAHLLTIRNLPAEEQQSATLRDDDLDVIHQRAIRKLYGNRTDEILRLVIQRPYFAIPTVLERMKTRHIEWVNCRREWSKIWRQITHQTQQKALDYQAATWKAEEKKTMLAKNILQDLRKKSAAAPRDIYTDPAVLDKLPAHLSFAMPNKKTFADIKKLLWAAVEVNGVKLEKSDLEACWDEFIAPLFGLPVPPTEPTPTNGENAEGGAVKPIAVQPGGQASSERSPALIATEPYFLMFRYISFLYERLEKAKQLAHNEEYPRNKPPHEEAANKEWNQAHPDENKMQVDGEEQPQVVIPEKGPFDDSAAEARYAKHFLEPLEVVLNTPQDPVAFEDEVRTHLGVEAYVLFTTERIIQFIVKQIQTVVADDELYDQLLGLYKYEFTRPAGFADSSYMNNARELLAEERRCYRFTYNQASGEFAITELNMTQTQQPTSALAQALADGATASTSTGGAAAASSPGASRRVPDDAASIVNNLVNSSQAESDGSAAPFLKRTLAAPDGRSVVVQNGLTVQVDPLSLKPKYVQDTEDVVLARTGTPNAAASNGTAKHLHDVLPQAKANGEQAQSMSLEEVVKQQQTTN